MLHHRRRRIWLLFGAIALITSVVASAGDGAWRMHLIDSRFRGANALGIGDANGDGFLDYVTNYEFDQRIGIALHPGAGADPRLPWPTVTAWAAEPDPLAGVNPEHVCFGDLDGDGLLDLVVAQGYSGLFGFEGSAPGVRLLFGEASGSAVSWADSGRIPATIDRGHFLYVETYDVNADGAIDIVAGGRVHGRNGTKAGLLWLEAPPNPADRRDASTWTIHTIDADQWSGHGFELADLDGDADKDIVLANADWDTPEEAEEICIYANPTIPSGALDAAGASSPSSGWHKCIVYRGSEFFAKPQIEVVDLDGDGTLDLLTQVRDVVYWFRRTSDVGVWKRTVIEKDPIAQGLGRPIRVGDLNGDGRLDLVGMRIHENGVLAADKAAAFWMESTGDASGASEWTTHVIKWGSGRTMNLPMFGEKWDQLVLTDVDGDGDLDLLANCEEWWEDGGLLAPFWDPDSLPAIVSVAWFENRLDEPSTVYEERDGRVAIEAEDWTRQLDGSWLSVNRLPGFGGTGYLLDHNTIALVGKAADDTRGAAYDVRLDGGTYGVSARVYVPTSWGSFGLGGSRSNGAWLVVDGQGFAIRVDDETAFGTWIWVDIVDGMSLPEGLHTLALRVSAGGFAIDQVRLNR